jgi:hypothetical protein
MFNPFQIYDAILGLNQEDEYEEVETITIVREIPEELVDEFNAMTDNFLADNGYDPLDFDTEEE